MYLVTVLEKSGDHGCLAVQSWPPISCPSVSQTIPPCPPKKPNDIARKSQKHKRRGPVPRHTSATARSDHAALCERPPEAPSPLCPSRPLGRPPCATSFHCFAPPVDRGAPRPGIARGGPAPRSRGGRPSLPPPPRTSTGVALARRPPPPSPPTPPTPQSTLANPRRAPSSLVGGCARPPLCSAPHGAGGVWGRRPPRRPRRSPDGPSRAADARAAGRPPLGRRRVGGGGGDGSVGSGGRARLFPGGPPPVPHRFLLFRGGVRPRGPAPTPAAAVDGSGSGGGNGRRRARLFPRRAPVARVGRGRNGRAGRGGPPPAP